MFCFFAAEIGHLNTFELDEKESHHIYHVLRLKEGEQIKITNGNGTIYLAEISSIKKNKCTVHILSKSQFEKKPFTLHLAIAPVKSNDRLGFLLEKITEIGVNNITPILTQNSERRKINSEKEKYTLIAAIKQSGNPFLPQLNEILNFSKFINAQKDFTGQKFICHCRENNNELLVKNYTAGKDVIICIGPEGDFTAAEIKYAEQLGFISISLGSNILRTETAAITAAIIINMVNQQ